MQMDARLSRMLHLLLHMGSSERPLTSEAAASMLRTNPVVVRRTLAGLRKAGHVSSLKGQGGGWVLARPLDQITMLDVYQALGAPRLFSMEPTKDAPECLVEQEVNASLAGAFAEARDVILTRLGKITLSEINAGFRGRLSAHAPRHTHSHSIVPGGFDV